MDRVLYQSGGAARQAAVRPTVHRPLRAGWGFTLVELLLSMAILTLLMVVLVNMVSQTGSMWHYTSAKIEEFREARNGYEAIARRLGQATLNTYWDYDNPNTPTRYLRQSELRFISGPGLAGGSSSTPPRPTHGVFFFAPLGFVVPADPADTTFVNYTGLDNLLNMWGYFVEFTDDSALKPAFATSPARNRFRLMEVMQSSQAMNLYGLEIKNGGNLAYTGMDWFQTVVDAPIGPSRPVHVLAENIVALVLLPKLTPEAEKAGNYTDASLAPGYLYDSTGTGMTTLADPNLNPKNQLPPIVQLTMVAIDETSANRLTAQDNQDLQTELGSLFTDPNALAGDLGGKSAAAGGESLQTYLTNRHINFRVFSSDVSIKGAKWSTN